MILTSRLAPWYEWTMATVQPQNSTSPNNAMLVGLMVGTAGLAMGCDAPESGSLENARRPAGPAAIDYNKLDYSKIDVAKIDAAKIDATQLNLATVDVSKLRLDERQLTTLAETNIKLVSSKTLNSETIRRLETVKVDDPKLAEMVKQMLDLSKAAQEFIGQDMRW